MVYMNYFRRTSSRFLSVPAYQQQRQSLLVIPEARTAPMSTALSLRRIPPTCSCALPSTLATTGESSIRELAESSSLHNFSAIRSKHSSRQIKRLFKQNPAKRRIALKQQKDNPQESGIIPESTIEPRILNPKILSNGWNVPVGDNDPKTLENYPFQVSRTKNKPNNAVGFLPVYSEHRKDGARVTTRIKKVTGDRNLFLNELRAALQIPIPKNPRDDTIRIRTGGTIEIKGNRVLEVKTWLASLGF